MKNFFHRYVLLLSVSLLPFILAGCFEDEVTFKGKAYIADDVLILDSSGGIIKETQLIRGPVGGATIKEASHPETAITDSSGNYTLKIQVPRVIGLEKGKQYRLECWASQASSGTVTMGNPIIINTGAADEPIAFYVEARTGDTVAVRDFVVSQHTVEKYLDQNGNPVGQ